MTNRPGRWLPALLQSPKTLRRRDVRLGLLALEDRLTPAGFTGPTLAGELVRLENPAAMPFQLLPAIPESPTRATSYFADRLAAATPFALDAAALQLQLAAAPAEYDPNPVIVSLPTPGGAFQRFRVWEVPIMEPGLAAQMPDTRTFRGQGIDDPAATLAADTTMLGFHTQVLSPNGSWYIDPYYHLDRSAYVSYRKADLAAPHDGHFACDVETPVTANRPSDSMADGGGSAGISLQGPTLAYGSQLRTFRTAVAATGEYTSFFGGTVAKAQAAIVTAMNRVSGVYEIEIATRLTLVAANSSVVYTNSATDPFTNTNGSTMLGQNQTNMTSVIGSANYDLGHVFSTGGGGVAVLNSVGNASTKAQGVTGSGSPTGDAFWIDYVAHEMGHQFGGNHTFNTANDTGNRNGATAYEPGSGSTIQAYAGIEGVEDLQAHSDAYFHVISLSEARNRINAIPSVGTTVSNGNTVPVVSAGADYSIPAGTPFALTATGSDVDGDALTYTWEQYDLTSANTLATISAGNTAAGPVMRSLPGTTSATRTIPRLANLLANTTLTGEYLSKVGRTLNFTVTTRDNRAGGGGVATDSNVVTVVAGTAFSVTSQNTAVNYAGGTSQTVTWNPGSTPAAPINAAQVRIRLSTDGGNTFPTILGTSANDGTETVTIPNLSTTTARIKVEPVNNIFFDISNANFSITPSTLTPTGIVPANGGTIPGPMVDLDITFNLPIDTATVGNDLVLSTGAVVGSSLVLPNVVRYSVAGLWTAGTLTASLPAGALATASGVTNAAASFSFTVAPPPAPTGFTVNGGDPQRSRITALEVPFSGPVTAANFNSLGAIRLQRTAVSTIPTGAVSDLVQTGPAADSHITVAQGTASSLVLTFDNNGSFLTGGTGVEYGSLTDGYWQLIVGSYSSTAGDLALRRLYGDNTADAGGTVDIADLTAFGNVFNGPGVAFDFDNNGVINTADLTAFGNRFNNVL